MSAEVHVSTLAAFSASRQVFRVYGHLLAVADGALVLVPLALVAGDCRGVLDGCPVPWEEVLAVLEAPALNPEPLPPGVFAAPLVGLTQGEFSTGWARDHIRPFFSGKRLATRWSHVSGVRLARL